jgi:hypothetical protein
VREAGKTDNPDDTDRELAQLIIGDANARDASAAESSAGAGEQAIVINMADRRAKEIDWLWFPRIAKGMLTMLAGDPGVGKGFLTVDIAARITKGIPWPDGMPCKQGGVLFAASEDLIDEVFVPRLDAAGADRNWIHLIRGVKDAKGIERDWLLRNVESLARVIDGMNAGGLNCQLVIVDPVNNHMGGDTDNHRDNEVRAQLNPFAKVLEEKRVAGLCIAHRNKCGNANADFSMLGSVGYVGRARATHHVGYDKGDESGKRILFLPGKSNVGPKVQGLAFRLPRLPNNAMPRVEWDPEPVDITPDEAFGNNGGNRRGRGPGRPSKLEEAMERLGELLAGGPMLANDALAEMKEANFSESTAREAKQALGVRHERSPEHDGKYVGSLPE